MVLKHINTQNNFKNMYNMNTRIQGNATEIPPLHISFEEFE